MDLTSIPSVGVHRDTATSDDPVGLVGAAPLNGQTGLFIYSKSPVQVWQRSAAGEWTVAATLTGAVGSRKHSINWGDLTRIYVKSTSGSDATVRFVGQTTSAPVAQGAAVNTWSGLSDTPNAYAGHGGKYPKVKVDESGIEFVESTGGGTPGGSNGQLQYNNSGQFSGTSVSYDGANSNIGIGTSNFAENSNTTLAIANGTPPSSGYDGQCVIYAKDVESEGSSANLILTFNGVDGDTSITDLSGNGHTFSRQGSAALTTADKVYGTAALDIPDGSSSFQADAHSDFAFGTGDFTVEMWVKGNDTSWGFYTSSGAAGYQFGLFVANNTYSVYKGGWQNSGVTYDPNVWVHVALVRSSGTATFYVNGNATNSWSDTTNYTDNTPRIGNYWASNSSWDGQGKIDDLRIIKGTAVYTGNFTPPAQSHGNAESYSELYVMDESGNETNISPHNDNGEWEFFSRNRHTGKCVRVNMERVLKRLEELNPGEKFIETWNEKSTPQLTDFDLSNPPE